MLIEKRGAEESYCTMEELTKSKWDKKMRNLTKIRTPLFQTSYTIKGKNLYWQYIK